MGSTDPGLHKNSLYFQLLCKSKSVQKWKVYLKKYEKKQSAVQLVMYLKSIKQNPVKYRYILYET